MKITELPQVTRAEISRLPSFVFTEPTSLETLCSIEIKNGTVRNILLQIINNIRQISKQKPKMAEELTVHLTTTLEIIQHGYKGICANDHVANEIANKIKSGL